MMTKSTLLLYTLVLCTLSCYSELSRVKRINYFVDEKTFSTSKLRARIPTAELKVCSFTQWISLTKGRSLQKCMKVSQKDQEHDMHNIGLKSK